MLRCALGIILVRRQVQVFQSLLLELEVVNALCCPEKLGDDQAELKVDLETTVYRLDLAKALNDSVLEYEGQLLHVTLLHVIWKVFELLQFLEELDDDTWTLCRALELLLHFSVQKSELL